MTVLVKRISFILSTLFALLCLPARGATLAIDPIFSPISVSQAQLHINGQCLKTDETITLTCPNALQQSIEVACKNQRFSAMCTYGEGGYNPFEVVFAMSYPSGDFVQEVLHVDTSIPPTPSIEDSSAVQCGKTLVSHGVYDFVPMLDVTCEDGAMVSYTEANRLVRDFAKKQARCVDGKASLGMPFTRPGTTTVKIMQTDPSGNVSQKIECPLSVSNTDLRVTSSIPLFGATVRDKTLNVSGTCAYGIESDFVSISCPGLIPVQVPCIEKKRGSGHFAMTCVYSNPLDIRQSIVVFQGSREFFTDPVHIDVARPPAPEILESSFYCDGSSTLVNYQRVENIRVSCEAGSKVKIASNGIKGLEYEQKRKFRHGGLPPEGEGEDEDQKDGGTSSEGDEDDIYAAARAIASSEIPTDPTDPNVIAEKEKLANVTFHTEEKNCENGEASFDIFFGKKGKHELTIVQDDSFGNRSHPKVCRAAFSESTFMPHPPEASVNLIGGEASFSGSCRVGGGPVSVACTVGQATKPAPCVADKNNPGYGSFEHVGCEYIMVDLENITDYTVISQGYTAHTYPVHIDTIGPKVDHWKFHTIPSNLSSVNTKVKDAPTVTVENLNNNDNGMSWALYADAGCSKQPVSNSLGRIPTTKTLSTTLEKEGPTKFFMRLRDAAQNSSCVNTGIEFTYDRSGPKEKDIASWWTLKDSQGNDLNQKVSNVSEITLGLDSQGKTFSNLRVYADATDCKTDSYRILSIDLPESFKTTYKIKHDRDKNYRYYASMRDDIGNETNCVYLNLEFTRDTQKPNLEDFNWHLSRPEQDSVSGLRTPVIQVDGAEDIEKGTLAIFDHEDCKQEIGSEQIVKEGEAYFEDLTLTKTSQGIVKFYAKISDEAGNTIACHNTGLSYNYHSKYNPPQMDKEVATLNAAKSSFTLHWEKPESEELSGFEYMLSSNEKEPEGDWQQIEAVEQQIINAEQLASDCQNHHVWMRSLYKNHEYTSPPKLVATLKKDIDAPTVGQELTSISDAYYNKAATISLKKLGAQDNCGITQVQVAIGTSKKNFNNVLDFTEIPGALKEGAIALESYQIKSAQDDFKLRLKAGVNYYTTLKLRDQAGNETRVTGKSWRFIPTLRSFADVKKLDRDYRGIVYFKGPRFSFYAYAQNRWILMASSSSEKTHRNLEIIWEPKSSKQIVRPGSNKILRFSPTKTPWSDFGKLSEVKINGNQGGGRYRKPAFSSSSSDRAILQQIMSGRSITSKPQQWQGSSANLMKSCGLESGLLHQGVLNGCNHGLTWWKQQYQMNTQVQGKKHHLHLWVR